MRSGTTATSRFLYDIFRMILPMCWLDSMRLCAAPASSSGYTASITGLTLPDAISGHTIRSSSRAIWALALDRLRTQSRASNREPPFCDQSQVDLRPGRLHCMDVYQPPVDAIARRLRSV
jgi:hypothetical protein